MKAKVLVIDDEPIIQDSCRAILEAEGYQVATAFSLREGVEALESGPFQLVITDLKMPGGSGMQVLRAVRDRWEDTAVVMITGYATVDSALEAMKLGAQDYLPKPFTPEQLLETVSKALKLQQLAHRKNRTHNALGRALRDIQASRQLDELMPLIVQAAANLVPCKGSAVFLLERSRCEWKLRASRGMSEACTDMGPVPIRKGIAEPGENRPLWIRDVCEDPRIQDPQALINEGVTSILCIPMAAAERTVGYLCMYFDQPAEFSEAETDVLRHFSEHVAVALERAHAFEEMEKGIEDLRRGLPRHLRSSSRDSV